MSRIQLRPAIVAQRTIEVETKPALWADKCDVCGAVFRMGEFCGEQHRGLLRGTFDRCAEDENGRGLNNMFEATVCSFACAHKIFAEGTWRALVKYAPFVKACAELARVELCLTQPMLTEAEIAEAWERAPGATPGAPVIAGAGVMARADHPR